MFIVARVSVDVHVIGVEVLWVFGLSSLVLATVVIHVCFGEVLDDSKPFAVDGRGSHDLGDDSGTCLSLHEFP